MRLGAKVTVEGGFIRAATETGRLKGANVYLDVVSVGATMNIMMAAVMAEGITVIESAILPAVILPIQAWMSFWQGRPTAHTTGRAVRRTKMVSVIRLR